MGLILLDSGDSFMAKLGFIIILISGFASSIWLFKAGTRKGIFNLTGESSATYDLDESMHQNDTNVTYGTTKEWIKDLKDKKISFNGGYIGLWGFHKDLSLGDFNQLEHYKINASGKLMLFFQNGNRLHVEGTNKVYYSDTFVKVIELTNMKWMWDHGKKHIECSFDGTKVKTIDNTNWTPRPLDLHLNAAPITIWRNV